MSNKKATLIIVTAIVLIAIAIVGFYLFFLKGQGNTPNDNAANPPSFPSLPNGGGNSGTVTTPGGNTSVGGTATAQIPRLRQISKDPTAGATFFDLPVSTSSKQTVIRYVDRATGNIFETSPTSLTATRISNKTIPTVYEASFASEGNSLLMRRVKDGSQTIETFAATLSKSASSTSLSLGGSFLTQNITQISVSPDKTKIFYLYNTDNGSVGIVANPDGSKKTLVFESSAREWLSDWSGAKTITIVNKPTAGVSGTAYFLDTSTGGLRQVMSGNGLSVLSSPDSKTVLYGIGEQNQNSLYLGSFSVKDGRKNNLSVQTLPEKCVWSGNNENVYCAVPNLIPTGSYPDFWYQGLVSFGDEIWKVDTTTGQTTFSASIVQLAGKDIDVINPTLDASEKYLMFINKKDLSLWILKI